MVQDAFTSARCTVWGALSSQVQFVVAINHTSYSYYWLTLSTGHSQSGYHTTPLRACTTQGLHGNLRTWGHWLVPPSHWWMPLLGKHLGTLEHFYVLIHWYHHDMIDRTYIQARDNIIQSLSTQSWELIPTPMYPDRPFPCMCVREIFKAVPYNPVHVQVQYIHVYMYMYICIHVLP